MAKRTFTAAAWIPKSPEMDWEEAAGLGATWIDERASVEGASGLLVTNALKDFNGFGDDYGRRDARRFLGRTSFDTDVLPSALMGAGCSDRAIKNLRKIIERM